MALRRIGGDWDMRVGAVVPIAAAVAVLVTGLSTATGDVIAYLVAYLITGRLNLVDGCDLFRLQSNCDRSQCRAGPSLPRWH
jgi:hypothetical protein